MSNFLFWFFTLMRMKWNIISASHLLISTFQSIWKTLRKERTRVGSFDEGIRGTDLIMFYKLLFFSVIALAQKQMIRRPKLTQKWKRLTMSWQVEQLKEELNSKEAQGEELKKRAAGLQAEVFAVRFILCVRWSHSGTLLLWLWVLTLSCSVAGSFAQY